MSLVPTRPLTTPVQQAQNETVITADNYTSYTTENDAFGTIFDFSLFEGRVVLDASLDDVFAQELVDPYMLVFPDEERLDQTLCIINRTSRTLAMSGNIIKTRGGCPISQGVPSGYTFFGRCVLNCYQDEVTYAYLIEYLNKSHS